jgi:hypothetical protein
MYVYDIHINMLQVIYKRKMEMERAVGGERKKHLISQLIFRFKLPGPLVASGDFLPSFLLVVVVVVLFPWAAPQQGSVQAVVRHALRAREKYISNI